MMEQYNNSQQSEKLTRQEMIDSQLKIVGWDVGDRRQVITEFYAGEVDTVQEEKGNYGKKQFCDYVLLGKDRKLLAVVGVKSRL